MVSACYLAACNGQAPTDAVSAEEVLSQYEYFGLMSDLPFDVPRVMHWSGAGVAQIDGVPALTAKSTSATLSLRFIDAVGRTLSGEFEHVSGEAPYFAGLMQRCVEERCEDGTWKLQPLSSARMEGPLGTEPSSPFGFGAPVGYDLVGELPDEEVSGDGANVVVNAGIAYVSRGQWGARIIDVGVPEDPRVLANLVPTEPNEVWNDVKLVGGRWLLIASSERGLKMFDVSDPSHPELAHEGFPGTRSNVHTIHVADDRLYLARVGSFGGLSVVDFSQKPALRLEAELSLPGCAEVHECFFDGARLFANCLSDGLRVYDVSDVSAPSELGNFPQSGSHSSAPFRDGLVLTSREGFALPLEVLRVEEGAVTRVSRLASGYASSPHNIACEEDRCWVAHHQEGLLEITIDHPDAPTVAAQVPTWAGPGRSFLEGASGVFVDLPWVYVADNVRGLLILRRWE